LIDIRGAETLLLVEDDPVLALTLATTLRYLGYRVHVAEDLPAALAHCTCPPGQVGVTDQGRVALALLSTAAPEARELVRRLREQLPDLRVLWLARGLATTGPGGDAWVVPCSFEALALRVRQALS
jgi:CheY-like chemotaxis protein